MLDTEFYDIVKLYVHILELKEPVISDKCLGEKEKKTLYSLYFKEDRATYYVSQIIKRKVLSNYLGIPAECLIFKMDNMGKCSVSPKIDFSSSRSRGVIAFGYSKRKIGIDIENSHISHEQYLAYREATLLENEKTFINNKKSLIINWTLKEAFMKYCGLGLRMSPTDFGYNMFNHKTILYLHKNGTIRHAECEYCVISLNNKYFISIAYDRSIRQIDVRLLNSDIRTEVVCNTSDVQIFFTHELFELESAL